MSAERDGLILSSELIERGESRWELDRMVDRGELVRIRRGAYARADAWRDLGAADRHRLLVRATREAARGEPVFSHESAAALQRIPIIGTWPSRVHVTAPSGTASSNSTVKRTRRTLPDTSIAIHESGARVTDPVTTVLDLAASRSLLSGIVAISHLRRATGLSCAALEQALAESGIQSGLRRARMAIARSAAASDSPLETIVVVRCHDLGFEPPIQQFAIDGLDGRGYRVDFAWQGGRILAESDGRGKYRDPELLAGRTPDEVLWAEKQRENAISPLCERFLRVTWGDAWAGEGLERALVHAGVPRPGRRRPLTR
ncbi:MAG TPA: type IV toxin-antitoxin system AbiEi family antitoxin domain-containing protein [Microbacteriaceae bacterium]|nr:type IV toxin-antitoxin system AbiEi family antitoxin domain-containing protein [Microbacteriaceae bacterium]